MGWRINKTGEICVSSPKNVVSWAAILILKINKQIQKDTRRSNVKQLVECARSRWKIENESFSELKNNGYHLEHNFGHGQKGLANVLLVLNFIAFAIHTVCDEMCRLWQKAREKLAARRDFFTHLALVPEYLYFDNWESLLKKLVQGRSP